MKKAVAGSNIFQYGYYAATDKFNGANRDSNFFIERLISLSWQIISANPR